MAQGEYMFKRTLFAEGIFRWMDAAAARFASPFLRERGKVRVIRATETVGTFGQGERRESPHEERADDFGSYISKNSSLS